MMRVGFDKRWLLPLGVLAASALFALGLIVSGRAGNEAAAGCPGASADYACYQDRYQNLGLRRPRPPRLSQGEYA
jgi:hypothetical protein